MILFFITFFTVYTLLNFYIFIRAFHLLPNNWIVKSSFIILFILVSYGYVLSKSLYKYLSVTVYDSWLTIGAIWFAMLVYFVLILFTIDLTLLLNKLFKFLPAFLFEYKSKVIIALSVFIFVSVIVFLGNLNKRDIITTTLEIQIPKLNSKIENLNIVLASDIHLSPIDGEKLLPKLVDKINSLNPDIILFTGDIVDDKAEILQAQGIGKSFLRLKSKYGLFTINGNHEFINGVESSIRYAEKLGMTVIRDTAILIDDSFYLIGREDSSKLRFDGVHRKALSSIVQELDSYPKILLDHTPFNLNEAVENGIDLQLSGHTHHGQIWPANLITSMIYEISWGYKKISDTHFYVTSGAGTWGPPVRTGSKSEIVNIKVAFR
jgi:predicted MPP superfamily phosphohydrolase